MLGNVAKPATHVAPAKGKRNKDAPATPDRAHNRGICLPLQRSIRLLPFAID